MEVEVHKDTLLKPGESATVEIALRGISDTASDGTILEDPLTINWWLTESNSATGTRFAEGTVSCPSGSTVKVNITNYLRQSST